MACEGNFFSFARRIHPVFHSPSLALIFQGCMAIVLVLTGTYQELYSYDMFATWAFFPLTVLALSIAPQGARASPTLSSLGLPLAPAYFRGCRTRDQSEP